MSIHLFLLKQNWKNRTVDTILTVLGLAIAVAVMTFFLALSFGLQNLIQQQISGTPLTQIEIRPLQNSLSPVSASEGITPEQIARIQQIPHITGIIPNLQLATFASVEISFLTKAFRSDAIIYGAPYQLISKSGISQADWEAQNPEYIPAIASSKILDLYNFSVAGNGAFPVIKKELLLGTKITILPGQNSLENSTDLPPIKAKLVGFSNQVQLLGLTLPQTTIDNYNSQHFQINPENNEFHTVLAGIDSPANYFAIKKELESLDLTTFSPIDDQENNINQIFLVLGSIFIVIITTALLLSAFIIIISTLTKIRGRYQEIGLLRTLGASQKNIQQFFLFESGLIGLLAGFLSLLIAFLFSLFIDWFFFTLILPPNLDLPSLFQFHWTIIVISPLFSCLFSLIFTAWPAYYAAKQTPIQAVNS